jgi:hypothetical protein
VSPDRSAEWELAELASRERAFGERACGARAKCPEGSGVDPGIPPARRGGRGSVLREHVGAERPLDERAKCPEGSGVDPGIPPARPEAHTTRTNRTARTARTNRTARTARTTRTARTNRTARTTRTTRTARTSTRTSTRHPHANRTSTRRSTIMTARTTNRRRTVVVGALAATLVAATVGLAAPQTASAATADQGWLRVGHLSPDTKGVDVELSSLAGGKTVFELDDVTYGQVSPYEKLPVGTYVLSMRAADAPRSTPVISTDVTVQKGDASTVVAYGKNDGLKTTAFTDDLQQPGDGKAKLRLVQAATTAKRVDVQTSDGTPIAEDATFGSATKYATVDAGKWSLDVSGSGQRGTAKVDLAGNTVSTLFVLDDSKGNLTVVPVTDAAATAATPSGGVQTGGGGAAADRPVTEAVHAAVAMLRSLFR